MKYIKTILLGLAIATTIASCTVQARTGVYVRGHYEYGPYGGRHWVPGHYAG